MNKNLYRIVFNKARGVLMVVADIARSGRAGSSRSSGLGHTLKQHLGKLSAINFGLLLALGAIQPVQAAIVADGRAPGGQQPTILNSANGTPQVNIQTPSAGGVSRNTYSQFDVDKKGVILNNSHNMTQTQQGGWVAGNPWLAKGEAKVILNEVNSRDPSRLNGYIEVGGGNAQVVIANPAGITCDGCGFINTNRATLTTGQAQMNNGELTGYKVERGEVRIEGAGMDSSRQDYTDIIARSVEINAGLWAGDLKVTTGINNVDAAHQRVDKQKDDPATRPQLAVDVSSLGGMYANKILLRATQSGVGVRNAGNIGVQAGGVEVNADGSIENIGNINSLGEMALTTNGGVNNSGVLFSGSNAGVTSKREVSNSGTIAARNNVRIQAAGLHSSKTSSLVAGVQQDGKLGGNGGLAVATSGELTAQGINMAADGLSLSGQGVDISGSKTVAKNIVLDARQSDLNTDLARVEAEQSLSASTSKTISNKAGQWVAGGNAKLSAARIGNQAGVMQSGQHLTLQVRDTLDNREQGLISANKNLQFDGGDILNQQGTIGSAGAASLNLVQLDNRDGKLVTQQALALHGTTFNNDDGGLIQSGDRLDINAVSVSNRNSGEHGGIISQDSMAIATTAFDNSHGLTMAGNNLQLHADNVLNSDGKLVAQNAFSLTTTGVGGLNNRDGLVQSGAGMQVHIQDALLDNNNGTLHSLGLMQLTAGDINNHTGTLGVKGDLTLATNSLDNNNGRIIGEQEAGLQTASLKNQNGQIQVVGNLLLNNVQGVIDNAMGLIRSGATVTLNAMQFTNSATRGENKGLEGQSLVLKTGSLDNQDGNILAAKELTLNNVGQLDNSDGQLLSGGNINLLMGQDLNNRGEMIANGNFNFTTSGDVTNSGKLLAGAKLDLNAHRLHNTASGEINAGQDWLTIADTLTNYGLIDGGHTLLQAATLNNIGTGRIYGDYVGVQALTFNNLAENGTAATLAGRNRVDIGVGTLNNSDHGLISSAEDMAIGGALDENYLAFGRAGELNNHSATIEATGDMTLEAEKINNINDHFSTELVTVASEKGITEYQMPGSDQRYRPDEVRVWHKEVNRLTLLANGATSKKYYQYNYDRTVQETQIKESDPAKIVAGRNLTVNADHLLNDKSQVIAGRTLALQGTEVVNGGVPGQRVTTEAGTLAYYYKKSRPGKDKQKIAISGYTPPATVQTIELRPGQLVSNGQVELDQPTLAPLTQQSVDTTIGHVAAAPAAVVMAGQQFEMSQGDSAVRIVGLDTHLPDNSLFSINPAVSGQYLVETDPQFSNRKTWLGSDYMIANLSNNQDTVLKRLGDGYYEQKLIRAQVINLTGQRYLDGYDSDEQQFKALMDQGVAFSNTYHLKVGVALTPEQMNLLTQDIVWMVNKQITLPDGTQQTVLVPQVYARVKPGDLDGSGALLVGRDIGINLDGNLLNKGGHIDGRGAVQLSADNIMNLAGKIRGDNVDLSARTDITNTGGVIWGGNALLADAGRDINIVSTTHSAQSVNGASRFDRTNIASMAGVYVQRDNGKLTLQADRDINLGAAQVANSGENGQTLLTAGRDLNLNTLTTASRDNVIWNRKHRLEQGNSQEVGSAVAGKGDVALQAGNDLHVRVGTITAGDTLNLHAERDLEIVNGENTRYLNEYHKVNGESGIAAKTTSVYQNAFDRQTVGSSTLSGERVNAWAGKDLLVQASDIASNQDLNLLAAHDLSINGATEKYTQQNINQKKKSGLMSPGGIGVTYGSQSMKMTANAQGQTNRGSTVGSTNGNANLKAGDHLQINGSGVVAANDIALSGANVSILAAQNQHSQTTKMQQKSSGITLALSGDVGKAISAVGSLLASMQQKAAPTNPTVAALQNMQMVLGGGQMVQQFVQSQADTSAPSTNTIGVQVNIGTQSTTSTQKVAQTTTTSSHLLAGNDLSITARGDGVTGQDGDINVKGSRLQANNEVSLDAKRDVTLSSAGNSMVMSSNTSSHGANLGGSIGVGTGGVGISVSAGVNMAKGNEKMDSTSHTETTISAGNQVSVTSGRDARLTGAQVSGDKVNVQVARDLLMESERDSNNYHAKQQSTSVGGQFTLGSMTGSGNLSLNQTKMHSNSQSVQEQTGIYAGKGGFDVRVGEHTQLNGAAIGSGATADKNHLTTGTLGFQNIGNKADFKVEQHGLNLASSPAAGSPSQQIGSNIASNLLGTYKGQEKSVTQAAVSDGSITIRDQDRQVQNVNDLSRDVEHANQTLSPIFDKQQEQQRLQQMQLIMALGSQLGQIATTQGEIAGAAAGKVELDAKGVKLPGKAATQQEWKHYGDQLKSTSAYKAAMQQWGPESALQLGIETSTTAAQGLSSSGLKGAAMGGSVPLITHAVANSADDMKTLQFISELNAAQKQFGKVE